MDPSLVLVIGLLCLVAAAVLRYRTKRFLARAMQAEGTVIAHAEELASDSTKVYAARVRFTRFDGMETEFVDRRADTTPRYPIGSKVPVIYDPAAGGGAQIPSALATWFMTGLLAFVGGAMVLYGGIRLLLRVLT